MIVRRATIRLTVQYSLVLLAIIALFAVGVALYTSAAFDLELPEATASEEAVDQANATLRTGLILCFGVLALIVPPISYLLARHTLAPVRANLEAQQRFVDDASHELRTPIAIAQGELELALLQPRTPEQYRTAMAEALGALEELGTLTTDLLILTRADRPDDAAARTELRDIAERALLAIPSELRTRVRLNANDSVAVSGYSELLVRAIANLLENAGKFADSDSPIDLTIERVGDNARITVSDTGPGLRPEQLSRAFDRFWRADTARSTPGRGIGLSIVRRIAELHGGRALLRIIPDRGTDAIIELPVATR